MCACTGFMVSCPGALGQRSIGVFGVVGFLIPELEVQQNPKPHDQNPRNFGRNFCLGFPTVIQSKVE